MPVVTSSSVTLDYCLGLVKDGKVKHIAGYVSDDSGGSVAVVFTDLQITGGAKTVPKKGLNLTATTCMAGGTELVPAAYSGRRVQLHLCKPTCTARGGTSCVHLGECCRLRPSS